MADETRDVVLYVEYYQGEKIGESHEEAAEWCRAHCRYCLAKIARRTDGQWSDWGAPWFVYCTTDHATLHAPVKEPTMFVNPQ